MSVINVNELQTCSTTIGYFGWAPIRDKSIPFVYRGNEKLCPERLVKAAVRKAHQRSVSRGESGYQIKAYFMTKAEVCLFNYIHARHCGSSTCRPFSTQDGMVSLTAVRSILETERQSEEPRMQPKENIVMDLD